MDLLPTDEQSEIVDATRAFLEAELPLARLQEGGALPRDTWKRMAELGWLGLGLDEAHGGVGYTLVEEALLFAELGRFLAPTGLLASALAARVAAAAGQPALAESILCGDARVALAEARTGARARVGGQLEGSFHILESNDAELVLFSDERASALAELGSLGALESLPCVDDATALCAIDLQATPSIAWEEREMIRQRGALLAAAMLVGIARATLDSASAHAREREQFGKPIGVFQAVKHRCADMAVQCEVAQSTVSYAALASRDGHADAAVQVSAAKSVATQAALHNTRANIQIHGGYGFTFESEAHFYLKRTHVLDRVMGSARDHLTTLIEPDLTRTEAAGHA